MDPASRSLRPLLLGGGVALLALVFGGVVLGTSGTSTPDQALRGISAALGWAEPLEPAAQAIHELRLWRVLCASLAGAALALSGVYLQGLFRNPLAAPGLLGVSTGGTLGATLAILVLGGYGPQLLLEGSRAWTPYALSGASFLGALATVSLVLGLARGTARTEPGTLLLVGVAVNATLGGAFVAVQAWVLDDWQVSQALLAWSFGTLDDRQAYHVWMIAAGLVPALLVVPRTAFALDLFQGGETDARRLGVATGTTRALVVVVASAATACAVSAVGAIGFIGLVVPHIARRLVGTGHARLLPAAAVLGALLLPALDLLQLALLDRRLLPPGAVTALLGGPFFLSMLLRHARGRDL